MKKALAGFFVFAAYLQSDGVVAAQGDCDPPKVAVASECVELPHAHPHLPHEDGAKERAPDAAPHEGEDVKIQIDEIMKDVVKGAVERR